MKKSFKIYQQSDWVQCVPTLHQLDLFKHLEFIPPNPSGHAGLSPGGARRRSFSQLSKEKLT